jgi:hypothetical protein
MGHRDPALISGGARSGTTFLCRQLVSHPDEQYCHDSVSMLVIMDIPFVLRREEFQTFADLTRCFLETFCRNLGEAKRALFDFAGLSWDPRIQDSIRNLESQDACKAGYSSIMRPRLASLDKWRGQLSGEQIAKIENIVCHSVLGRRFFDKGAAQGERAL